MTSLTNQTELTAITFYSRLMGIAAAKYNTLLYTIDGGNTWIEYSINQPHTFALIGQMCPAGNNAFYGINQDGSSGQIFRGTISPKGKVHSNDQAIVDIKLYPQPAHNVVSLGGIEAFGQQCKVSISSCLGTIEMTKHFVSGEGTAYSIDVSTLTSGFHYITIENTQGNRVTKPLMILR